MSKYDDARNRVGEILTETVGNEEAARLLSDVVVGAYWRGAETAVNQEFRKADRYLRQEK